MAQDRKYTATIGSFKGHPTITFESEPYTIHIRGVATVTTDKFSFGVKKAQAILQFLPLVQELATK